MFAVFCVVVSIFGFSLNRLVNKKLIQRLSEIKSLIFCNLFMVVFAFFLSLWRGDYSHDFSFSFFLIVFLAGLVGFLALYFLLLSFKRVYLGQALAIANLYPFLVLLLSVLFCDERVVLVDLLIIFVVCLGINLTLDFKSVSFNRFLLYPFFTFVGWGIYDFLIFFVQRSGVNSYNVVFYLELSVFLFSVLYFVFKKDESFEFSEFFCLESLGWSFLGGFLNLCGCLGFALAIEVLPVNLVSSLITTQVLFASFFAFLFFDERISRREIFGLVLIVVCLFVFNFLN